MGEIFHLVLTKPLLNILIWFYNIIPGQDMGLAIIALTLLIRLLLVPSFQKSLRSQKELQELQPKLDELKEKHKGDRETQTKAVLEFYRQNKVNPFSSCLPILVQLPILFALYRVFLTGLNGELGGELYSFVATPAKINTIFLGLIELKKSNLALAFLAGVSQFFQSKMFVKKPSSSALPQDKTASLINVQFTYFMPILTVIIAMSLPAGLSLYWLVTTLFAIGQQYYIIKKA